MFSFGRDHGMFGRILNQTVIVSQSLAMRGDKEIVGTCFTPAGRQLAFEQHRRVAVVYVSGFLRREARAGETLFLQRDLKHS